MKRYLTKEELLPIAAVLLALAELGTCAYFVVRVSATLDKYPDPVLEAPPGFDTYAYERPAVVLVLILLVTIGTAVTAFLSHPRTEHDPSYRLSPWVPMVVALGGLLILPGLFSEVYLASLFLLALAAKSFGREIWRKLQQRGN